MFDRAWNNCCLLPPGGAVYHAPAEIFQAIKQQSEVLVAVNVAGPVFTVQRAPTDSDVYYIWMRDLVGMHVHTCRQEPLLQRCPSVTCRYCVKTNEHGMMHLH